MSFSSHNEFDRSSGAIEAEKTLRMIAALPAPKGIEERLKAGLRTSPRQAKLIRWPMAGGYRNGLIHTSAVRAAAAAAIVIAVAGGGWEVYSHIQVAAIPSNLTAPLPISGQSGFAAATTRRVPQTLEGPVTKAPPTMKPKTPHPHAGLGPAGRRAAHAKPPGHRAQVEP